jgi:hypothetical protein
MTHVFFDPDKRGDRTLQDAEATKAKLIAMKQPPQDARSFGDPFMLQSYYPERSEAELAKLFGRGFAQPVFKYQAPFRKGHPRKCDSTHDPHAP